ncbi:glyceraldehyde 3-phosphate reductase [Streptomyces narbonensis]
MGCISFVPLAQGLLTNKYLKGIPEGSRATQGKSLDPNLLSDEVLRRLRGLAGIAERRGQSLAQLALAWVLRDERMTSALIGASSVAQLEENVAALAGAPLTAEELKEIDSFAVDTAGTNIWASRGGHRARRPEKEKRAGPWGGYGPARGGGSTITLR